MALLEAGHKVELIVGAIYEPNSAWDLSNIKVHQIASLVKPVSIRKDLLALIKLISTIRKARPDVVHTHLAKGGILGRLAARLNGSRIIHTVHGPTFHGEGSRLSNFLFWSLEFVTGFWTDLTIFVGEELRSNYQRYGIGRGRTEIIETGKNQNFIRSCLEQVTTEDRHQFREALNASQESIILCYPARMAQSKGHHRLIPIVQSLVDRGLCPHLVFIGEAVSRDELEYEAKLKSSFVKAGLGNLVHFLGFVNEVERVMKCSDVVVMTSFYEGLPNVAVEAILCATYFVCYRVSGVEEILDNGFVGKMVQQDDVAGFVNAIEHSLTSSPTRTARQLEWRLKIVTRFAEERMTRNMVSAHESVV